MKKHNTKIIIGWILIAIQVMAIIGRLLNQTRFPTGIPGFFNIIGFFSFAIVGIILLILGYKPQKLKQNTETQPETIAETPPIKNTPHKNYFYITIGVAITAIVVLVVVLVMNSLPDNKDNSPYTSCADCRGSGSVVCSSCRGTGKQTCNTCGGDSIAKCTRCPKCFWCDGDGVRTVNGTLTLCGHCTAGKMDCSFCSNKRDIECYNCNGGVADCGTCSNGKKTCRACKGTGKIENK